MRKFAAASILTIWYAHFDVEDAIARLKSDLPERDHATTRHWPTRLPGRVQAPTGI